MNSVIVVDSSLSLASLPRRDRVIVVSKEMKTALEEILLDKYGRPLWQHMKWDAPAPNPNLACRDDGRPLRREMTRRFPQLTRRQRRSMLRDVGRGPGKLV